MSSSSAPNAVVDDGAMVDSVDARASGRASIVVFMSCCVGEDTTKAGDAENVVSEGVTLHGNGGEGTLTLLDAPFRRASSEIVLNLSAL